MDNMMRRSMLEGIKDFKPKNARPNTRASGGSIMLWKNNKSFNHT